MNPARPIRILVDLTGLREGGEGGGIKPALLAMLRWLAAHSGDRLHFVYAANAETRTEVLRLARLEDKVIMAVDATTTTAAQLGCDLVYCPFGVTDLACPGVPTLTLIVDLLHRDFPATLPDPDRIYREQKFTAAVKVTDRFQVISDYTASRLQTCYAVPPERIFRTYQPIHGRLTALATDTGRKPAGVDRPFFLYPANFWIHKNHDGLLKAYALYRQEAAADAWPLVLAGHVDEARLALLRTEIRALKIENAVHFTGYVLDEALAGYYRSAGALVFPSLHEGFGIPLVEAMAFGTPIVASNAGSIPEITGAAALLVDARDPAALAAALRQMAADPTLRTALAAKGRHRIGQFSLDEQYGRLLEEMCRTAQQPARWQRSGFYAEDGLTDPIAIFGLPPTDSQLTLVIRNRPLPVDRKLLVHCGRDLLVERLLPAGQTVEQTVTFRPLARAVILRVPDASPLCATDPRTHGILLASLQARTMDGMVHDLLGRSASPTPAAAPTITPFDQTQPKRPHFTHLWHIETALPAQLANGYLELRGWCIGPGDQPARLRLRINDMVWAFQASQPRPDVRAVHPRMSTDACGFAVRMRIPAGRHTLVLEAVDSADLPVQLLNHPLTVPLTVALNRWLRTDNASLVAFQLMVGPSFAPRALGRERFSRPSLPPEQWPRLSIVTPSYQQGRFLAQTMQSVLDQPGVACDYVVQDGGSGDGSKALIERFAAEQGARDKGQGKTESPGGIRNADFASSPPAPCSLPPSPRLASWSSEPDHGQADAIVRGFAKTSGGPDDLMAWINSDDFYLPGTLPFVADYFARHPEVDVLYGNRILVDEDSRAIGRWFLPRHDDAVLRLNDFVPQETLFWRRRIWERAGPVDPTFNFAMDWDLLLRFQAAGARIAHVPYFLACFRVHASQKTLSTMQSVGQQEIDRLRARACGRVLTPAELETDPRMITYLRRSALVEIAWSLGLRLD